MNGTMGLRGERRALSSLYGAFIVVLVTALVAGVIASQTVMPGPSSTAAQREADRFLETLLLSTINGTNESAMAAVAHLCLASPCAPYDLTPHSTMMGLDPLASKLAAALGRDYRLSLSDGAGHVWQAGPLAPDHAAALSTVQVLHVTSGQTLALSALVGSR